MQKKMVVLAFEGISPFHLSVPSIVFSGRVFGGDTYDVLVCAEQKGQLATAAGFSLLVEHDLSELLTADVVIVPSWHEEVDTPVSPALALGLQQAFQRGCQIVGLCLGAYVLAASGLLTGKCATTHWAFAEDFARRFPDVRLQADVLYVRDGSCMTSAGTAAGLDCCLSLIREWHGAEIANQIARVLVVPPHRQGGQAQFVSQPVPLSSNGGRLDELMDEIRADLQQTFSIDEVAARIHMSRRTFTRQFRQRTGRSFGDWLLNERLFYAQRLLESSDLAMDRIAVKAGFSTSATFRYHFGKQFGVSPMVWRKTFVR